MTRNSSRVGPRALVAALATALVATFVLATSSSAQAVAGDPFDPDQARVLSGQDDPTRLFDVDRVAPNQFAFTPRGPASDIRYNALAFNTDDNYLYAIVADPLGTQVPDGALIRIGNAGGYEQVGTETFVGDGSPEQTFTLGAYDESTQEMVIAQGTPSGGPPPFSTMVRIDLDPGSPDFGEEVDSVSIDPEYAGSAFGADFAFSGGELFSLGPDGIGRFSSDGSFDSWPVPTNASSSTAGDQAGSAWTFLGGDLGFSYNNSGQVIRIRVTNPSSANPSFEVLYRVQGSPSSNNDGAAVPGTADLALEKTGELLSGDRVRWVLTLTNLGGADSTGWTITDELPDGLSNIEVSGDGSPSVSGSTVTASGGYLPVGAERTVTVTADIDDAGDSLVNDASVEGNDPDPVEANNVASVELDLVDDPAAPDTGIERESMVLTYAALTTGLLMLLALLVWRGVAARRE